MVVGFVVVWFFLLISVMDNKEAPKVAKSFDSLQVIPVENSNIESVVDNSLTPDYSAKLSLPKRYEAKETFIDPPPMAEVERNMTLYLTTLHKRLTALAGPTVDALVVWETFLEVTRDMPMTWDEQNAYRFPKPRSDGSIIVSLGTYRDPYCPMTIKSLYKNAKHPEKVVVGMFQQNCFGPKCRTGDDHFPSDGS